MRLSQLLLILGLGAYQTVAFAVFAHFMVGNTLNYGFDDWKADMVAAQTAGIDAFALNVARDEQANIEITQAFEVAVSLGFKLFFSFDYAGGGPWEKASVIRWINTWKGSAAYYKRGSQALVSTFEGPGNAAEWIDIKAQTGCFFVPDYSSLGAKRATLAGSGVADGLFSWAAWPAGPRDMDTYGDASYMQFLAQAGKSTYMMPVSPAFYTNLPGYKKNWLWRGDDLWFDRWLQVIYLARIQKDFAAPEFAQIISWNDFGESHYIGPVIPKATYALNANHGKAPFDYATYVTHGGFRRMLPFQIQLAKTGVATVGTTSVSMWYRNSAVSACGFSDTVANTCQQLQLEYSPAAVVQDKIFYTALLGASAAVTVTVGGVSLGATWTDTPPTGVGLYHGSASFAGKTGQVVVTVAGIATVVGDAPIGGCTTQNFNPYAYAANGPASSATLNINSHVCVGGFGTGAFANVCKFACALGYCPVTACTCTRIGPQPPRPTALQKNGYVTDGNRNFEGLCSFSVNYGYTGKECSLAKPASTFIPALSPFFPNTTTSGVGLLPKFTATYGQVNRDLCFEPPPVVTTWTTTTLAPTATKPPVIVTVTVTVDPPAPTPTNIWRIYIGSEVSVPQPYDNLWLSTDATIGCGGGASNYPLHVTPPLLNPEDDVSQDQGYACDGCQGEGDAGTWTITRLEMFDYIDSSLWAYGITTSHVGYITAYQQPDGTYNLVSTPKIGDPFINQGKCVRAPPDSDKFECEDLFGGRGGKHVLTCTSFLKANTEVME